MIENLLNNEIINETKKDNFSSFFTFWKFQRSAGAIPLGFLCLPMVLLARKIKMADAVVPFVSFNNITYFRSFVSCFIIAVAYVVSLYINKSPLPR